MSDYPTRDIDRTDGNPLFPDGLPTAEEHAFMEDHAEARRINEFRDECYEADFMDFREQDTYVGDSSVTSMLWEVADGADHLFYQMGTLYLRGDDGEILARVRIAERTPPEGPTPPGDTRTPGASMCLAFETPPTPIDSLEDEVYVDWVRQERLADSEDVTEHGGPHGIVAQRMWDQRAVASTLADTFDVDEPELR